MAIKINLVVRLQHWMDSVPGQTFLNYAYSWGASIVILGALFKLTHLPGGNMMLFLGMGTEVVVFFLSAFDRPFDKNEVGKELPPDYETDEEIAARLGLVDDEADEAEEVGRPVAASDTGRVAAPAAAQGDRTGGTIILGTVAQAAGGMPVAAGCTPPPANVSSSQPATALNVPEGDDEVQRLAAIIREANNELLRRAQATLSPEMEAATATYIEKLRTLTETFAKVDEQSARLTKDSEEMDNLNRTLTGINKVYELHLKSISLQVGTIDKINDQTHKLATQIEELNAVYGRMIEALTVNMRPAASTPASANTPS